MKISIIQNSPVANFNVKACCNKRSSEIDTCSLPNDEILSQICVPF